MILNKEVESKTSRLLCLTHPKVYSDIQLRFFLDSLWNTPFWRSSFLTSEAFQSAIFGNFFQKSRVRNFFSMIFRILSSIIEVQRAEAGAWSVPAAREGIPKRVPLSVGGPCTEKKKAPCGRLFRNTRVRIPPGESR